MTTGQEKFIEVKTTQFGAEAPFFVTRPEVEFSAERTDAYELYCVFRFRTDPHLFTLSGSLETSCRLAAQQFVATPR